jgi:hypothetical protein
VAIYTFSRNLSRLASLNRERTAVLEGLRNAVAGDDAALYNALLLTLRDAAKVPGRKVVIVFSNGPDNASMVAPDDVRAVAEDEGIPIYVISTNDVNKDPVSSGVFRRLAGRTGGKSFFARTWQKQVEAFEAIREDLGNSYTVTYYPQANPNEGFRRAIARGPAHSGGRAAALAPATHDLPASREPSLPVSGNLAPPAIDAVDPRSPTRSATRVPVAREPNQLRHQPGTGVDW